MKSFNTIAVMMMTTWLCVAGESSSAQNVPEPDWWWDCSYKPVVVVRGSLAETKKDRPDISIQGPYAAWSRLTAPSLAAEPTEKGFHMLITKLKVEEVIYVDKTLMHCDVSIDRLADGRLKEKDCMLPAEIRHAAEPDAEGRYVFTYELSLTGGGGPRTPNTEYVLVFSYSHLYPLQGLYLTSCAEIDKIGEVRKICERRKNDNAKGEKHK